jgi:hypothetical protein
MAQQHLARGPATVIPLARFPLLREFKDRGSLLSCLAPCPLSGVEVNPTRRRAAPARSQSFHPQSNVHARRHS